MDTSKMLHLKEIDTIDASLLFAKSSDLKDFAETLYSKMEIALVRNQIIDIVHNHYDIGKVLDIYQIFGGYVNKSYGIYTEKDGQQHTYFIRKYKIGIVENEIRFEHDLIECAIENGLDIAAGLIHAKDGNTFVKITEDNQGKIIDRYFAIYTYLEGEDKYTWDNPTLNDQEYESSARVLAKLHDSTKNFDPKGLERVELKIMDLILTLPEIFRQFAKVDLQNKFHDYYLKSVDEIVEEMERAITLIPPEEVEKMPLNPIHCDIHPGNLKFMDNKAVGIFDFDWAKIDLRLFDVCEALLYFCTSWEEETDGKLLLSKCAIFLRAYQDKLKELGGLEPLNEAELKYLPEMLIIANVYLFNWCVPAYYADPTLNVFEYKAYLSHHIKLSRYLKRHMEDIIEMVKTINN